MAASSSSTRAEPNPNASNDSVTAMDYINTQLQLESGAREALPYTFDECTRPLGRLRQTVYSCRTCAPLHPSPAPGFGETKSAGAAALCYSCSISCHGNHELVELFDKRDVRCDCGTGRLPGVRCDLRKTVDEEVEADAEGTAYGQNYWGRFCICQINYDPEKEGGMMYQCLLGDICGEDWFHDVCLVGKGPPKYASEGVDAGGKEGVKKDDSKETTNDSNGAAESEATPQKGVNVVAVPDPQPTIEETFGEHTVAAAEEEEGEGEEEEDDVESATISLGFPKEFEQLICWRCLDANPWLKHYATTPGFFALARKDPTSNTTTVDTSSLALDQPELQLGQKRKAEGDDDDDDDDTDAQSSPKRLREVGSGDSDSPAAITTAVEITTLAAIAACTRPPLPSSLPATFSLLLPEEFRTFLCRCPACFPQLQSHRILLEPEESHQPPLSRPTSPAGSIFEEGEKALNSIDRVRAIEGVLAYNKLKDRVKAFLEPFAKSGKAVGVEDVKDYFEGLKEEGK